MMSTQTGAYAGMLIVCATVTLTGCSPKDDDKDKIGPPQVSVVAVHANQLTLTTELPGRTSPYAISDVRPQVGGIILSRLFEEGADVKAGQPLYQIDPSTYQASFDQAQAQLANARANLKTSKLKAARYAELVTLKGVSKQDFDDADAAFGQAAATVAADQASLETARINLRYTLITAPISGRIGRSSFTEGALVTTAQTNALTTIQTLDPIYVDITESTAELLKLRRGLGDGALTKNGPTFAAITLRLEDGSAYPLAGKIKLTDVTVDQTTGSVALRAVFPNPDGILLPGMYVRAIVPQATDPMALLAPQRGISRDPTGQALAMIVDADGRAQSRSIETGRMIGDSWLVTKGLKSGDRVIVDGLQKVHAGSPVLITPAAPPQAPDLSPQR